MQRVPKPYNCYNRYNRYKPGWYAGPHYLASIFHMLKKNVKETKVVTRTFNKYRTKFLMKRVLEGANHTYTTR